MKVKEIQYENFQDYKEPYMFIATCYCNWKCSKELNLDKNICQNSKWYNMPNIDISNDIICENYIKNEITKAIVIGGLEPFLQFAELYVLIFAIRNQYNINDNIIIYTGYYENEVSEQINVLKNFRNIIVKFGRYIPNSNKKYDSILGIELASDNQYATKIS